MTEDRFDGYSKTKWYQFRIGDVTFDKISNEQTVSDILHSRVYCLKCQAVHERGKCALTQMNNGSP